MCVMIICINVKKSKSGLRLWVCTTRWDLNSSNTRKTNRNILGFRLWVIVYHICNDMFNCKLVPKSLE